jgi:hypothetical protein
MTSPVVLVGTDDDVHVAVVVERLRAAGVPVLVLSSDAFPATLRITLGTDLDDVTVDGKPLRPSAVFVRDVDDLLLAVVHRWDEAGIPVYNGTLRRARLTRPLQRALLRAAGLPVPETRWTNDPDEIRRFAAERRVTCAPLSRGSAALELGAADLGDERLAALCAAPVAVHALLPGEDLRVYVLDDEVVAAIGLGATVEAVPLPDDVIAQCRLAAATLGLRFAGIDLARDADGILRFVEVNPSPSFVGFDELTGTEVGVRLAARLAAWSVMPGHVFVRVRAASPRP